MEANFFTLIPQGQIYPGKIISDTNVFGKRDFFVLVVGLSLYEMLSTSLTSRDPITTDLVMDQRNNALMLRLKPLLIYGQVLQSRSGCFLKISQ